MPQQGDMLRQYLLVHRRDQDALGDVWEAEHEVSHTRVIIRVLWPGRVRPDAQSRVLPCLGIGNAHLLPLVDSVLDVGWPHLLYAHTEATRLDAALGEDGAVPWASAAEVAAQILTGLQELHSHGVAYGQVLVTSVYVTEESVVLGDLGLQAAYTPDVLGALGDAAAVFGEAGEPTPAGDVAGVAGLLWSMVSGQPVEGELASLSSFDPDAPAELDAFIAACRLPPDIGPYTGTEEALRDLRRIIDRGLGATIEQDAQSEAGRTPEGVAAGEAEPDTSVPSSRPTAEGSSETGAAEQRLHDLMLRREREGAAPELDAEIKRLQAEQGREQLAKAAGLRGTARMARLGPSSGFAWTVPGSISLIVFVVLWVIIHMALRGTPMDSTTRLAISVLAPALLIGVCLWIAVALGTTKRQVRCLAVITDSEVVCHEQRNLTQLLRIPAPGVRMVSIVSPGDPARNEPARVRITGWDDSITTLEFLEARLFQEEEEEEGK